MEEKLFVEFLAKYEKFLGPSTRLITPDNWQYFKDNGCLPPITDEEELKARFVKAGFSKPKIIEAFKAGTLPKDDLIELFDELFSKEELSEMADESSEHCLFGSPDESDWSLNEVLLDYLEQ